MPADLTARLIISQAQLPLALFKAAFTEPAQVGHAHKSGQRIRHGLATGSEDAKR